MSFYEKEFQFILKYLWAFKSQILLINNLICYLLSAASRILSHRSAKYTPILYFYCKNANRIKKILQEIKLETNFCGVQLGEFWFRLSFRVSRNFRRKWKNQLLPLNNQRSAKNTPKWLLEENSFSYANS